jgi:hypothetical protein
MVPARPGARGRRISGAVLGLTLLLGPGLARPEAPEQPALGRVEIGASAPAFSLEGADGAVHGPFEARGRLLVLEWTNPLCPFTAAAYRSGAMQALQRRVRQAGGVWFAVDTAARTAPGWIAPKAATARLEALGATISAFLYDETGAVGRLYGARATPSLYIIDARGALRYQGGLEAAAPGEAQVRPYAALALKALLDGRPVRAPETRPTGCPVEY